MYGAVARVALVAVAYFWTAKLGLAAHAEVSGSITLVWPPAGLAVAAVLVWGRSMAVGVYAGAMLVNLTTGDAGPLAAALIGIGNTIEALICSELIRRWRPEFPLAADRQDALAFSVAAALAATVAALVGTEALVATHALPPDSLGEGWLTWWAGDALGIALFAPLVVMFITPTEPIGTDNGH